MIDSKTRRVLPLGLAVALSLFGDLSLFAGLVTQLDGLRLSLPEVGILLSVHRLVRIPGNLVVGLLLERVGRRPLFLLGMVLAVLSTAAYGLVSGFWPFLAARVAWGAAWALINVSGTTLVLDLSEPGDRGRLTGLYSAWIWVGYALGPLAGSLLTDALNFQKAMLICAACSAVGLGAAYWGVQETFNPISPRSHGEHGVFLKTLRGLRGSVVNIFSVGQGRVMGMLLVVNFSGDGVMLATLTLLLSERVGEKAALGPWMLSTVAAGGIFIAGRAVLAGLAALGAGRLSDGRLGRPPLLALGLICAAASFGVLAAAGSLAALGLGLALNALGTGAVLAVLPAVLRDRTSPAQLGPAMGAYAMAGDIGSTLGPALAFALAPLAGLAAVYGLCLGLLGLAGGVSVLEVLPPGWNPLKIK